jgi:uncharacterized protein YbjT (DUF2867 family)
MYLVTGITGKTGAAVADALVTRGEAVRALVRSADKAAPWAERGVELVEGTLDDRASVERALEGVKGAYLMLPPVWGAHDYFAAQAPMIEAIRAALEAKAPPRTVALSSVAVHQPEGTGPIQGLRPFERALGAFDGVTFLRAAYFHENLATVLSPAQSDGVFPVFFDPDHRFPMVATRDIGARAAALVLESDAPRIVNLAGPEDHTMREAAATLSELLGRELEVKRMPPEALASMLKDMGAGHLAELYAELNRAMDQGLLEFETPPAVERGATPLSSTLQALTAS